MSDASLALNKPKRVAGFQLPDVIVAIRSGLLTALVLAILAIFLLNVVQPLIASIGIEETVSSVLGRFVLLILPFVAYIASTNTVREWAKDHLPHAILTALLAMVVIFLVIALGQFLTNTGPFGPQPTLEFAFSQADEGVLVESVVAGGVADEAGLQVGDIITAVRRDPVDATDLQIRIGQSQDDDPFRLRFLRDGEELQETLRIIYVAEPNVPNLVSSFIIGVVFTVIVVFWPGGWTPYVILVALLSPLVTGYVWVIIATFSFRTNGIVPLDSEGNFSLQAFTLENWQAIFDGDIAGRPFDIFPILVTSLAIALIMTFLILLVSSMAGYALSRMSFPGRRSFLSFTLILHGFPAITLLIPIFVILLALGSIPVIGQFIGFGKVGGIALVMVAFQLPLGVWLMKGFFDNIPWDMERSALIDGASRFRTYWQILLPQIRPGLLALGIFAFISGWNAYIIPATYSIGAGFNNLPVFINDLVEETAPVNWNQVAAVGMFQLIPIFVFFIFAQEYLLNIYAGGTKGSS